jgi:hypothetical protein
MNLTRENKLDAISGLFAVIGVILTLVASEFSLHILMALGAAIVILTAIVRVSYFRGSRPHLR